MSPACSLVSPEDAGRYEPRAILNLADQALGPDPEKALYAIRVLRGDLERVERMQVACALDSGRSWAQIGRAVGVSRQAVHQKYCGRRPDAPEARPEKCPTLGARVRLAILIARTEAACRREVVVGTEHLLAGLMQQGEGAAVELLDELGATMRALRAALDALTPSGASKRTPSTLSLSGRARPALTLAATCAARERAPEVADVHLLRALVADPTARAVQVLRGLGIERGEITAALKVRHGTNMEFAA